MQDRKRIDEQLSVLAAYLADRRKAILKAWRAAVDADPSLATAGSLPRTQFHDHIPDVLDAFQRRLRAAPAPESAAAKEARNENAAAHGVQRWQQGYHLREVTREWGHLHLCLVDELEGYLRTRELLPEAVAITRRALASLISDGVSESTARYFDLQEVEADGQLRDLEQLLTRMQALERERAELWREAAHDLRGNLGTVANATAGLALDGVPEPMRARFLRLLQHSVAAQRAMLDDLTSLARLQAGREQRDVQPFDAAALLQELCASLQALADERGLTLKVSGPPAMPVHGDAVKTRRIAQNLVHNALKYTQRGGVTVSWGDSRANDDERWMLVVQDTGPGLRQGGAPLAAAIEEATEESLQLEDCAPAKAEMTSGGETPAGGRPAERRAVQRERGEGVGLSIVKRLCELLDAGLEVESEPGLGTTLRVLFPRDCRRAGPPS